MGHNHCTQSTLESTDLSWDGISHLKMQNTLNVKPHKHTLMLPSHLHIQEFNRPVEIQVLYKRPSL